MKRPLHIAIALTAFVLGCTAATVVVPPTTAEPAGEKFEYLCIHRPAHKPAKLTEHLNELGQAGWELETIDGTVVNGTNMEKIYCFSRER